MRVINVRNVHAALPVAIEMLREDGIHRDSRNGPVRIAPYAVTTVYSHPAERVCFWPERDANPFFHLYESLWMLSGRNDIAPLVRYVKRIADYSDNGQTLNDAYGYRWRAWFDEDQLVTIAKRLTENPDDRRSVLQMWDADYDLGYNGKAVPCNTVATFQRDSSGRLDLTVFCRSNDIIWGAYGANAVQFGTLLEYMSARIGCPIGVYRQISVNWHAYLNTFNPLLNLGQDKPLQICTLETCNKCGGGKLVRKHDNPYEHSRVRVLPLGVTPGNVMDWDEGVSELLIEVDKGFPTETFTHNLKCYPYLCMVYTVMLAHKVYKDAGDLTQAIELLNLTQWQDVDWVVAAREWLQRRQTKS